MYDLALKLVLNEFPTVEQGEQGLSKRGSDDLLGAEENGRRALQQHTTLLEEHSTIEITIPPLKTHLLDTLLPDSPQPEHEQQQQPPLFVNSNDHVAANFTTSPEITAPIPPPPPPPAAIVAAPQQRFFSAPPVFSAANVPMYSPFPEAVPGPVNASMMAAVSPPGECQMLGALLGTIPEVSSWLALMRRAGLENTILNVRKNMKPITILVSINSAFNAQIDAAPLRPERSLQELMDNAPELTNSLVGYTVIRGLWPKSALNSSPGVLLPTANTLDKVHPLNLTVLNGGTVLRGIGNVAQILQADIAACGPIVVHIIDQILLPFTFDQAPTDAIKGTQVAAAANTKTAA